MKRKLMPTDKPIPPNPKTELKFTPASPEQVKHSIEYIGLRDKLDKAFKAAIARAKKAVK